MPELPEMEAWRRQLNDPVSAFPIAKAGPAHIATLKTFDPPLQALEGRQLRGVERRGKRLLFPTADGELVLLVHLMTSGRLKSLRAGESGPKTPAFALEFAGGERAGFTIRCECFDDLPGALSSRDRHIVSMRHVEHVNPAAGPE